MRAAGVGTTLVLGLGNSILGDDGVGPAVARSVARAVARRSDVVVEEAAADGLELLDLVIGHSRLVLVDAVPTSGGAPGTVHRYDRGELLAPHRAAALHEVNLATAMTVARRLGLEVPTEIVIYAIEVEDGGSFHDGLSAPAAAAVPVVVERVLRELA